ncbi:YkgJ family cysteine cluster protein, partial [Ferroglobus sp.]|uniref:YkgJ family cysteine cluster protein n=1 Tax=Ferroglobus sp. TaxID=2614230 RepID=UPI0025BA7FC0
MEVVLDCLKINCHKCCEETEMQLSKHDIRRIEKLGYKVDEFSEIKDGVRVLKNVNGKCFFLRNGKCSIYEFRPFGCKLYPIVWDVERKRA